MATSQNGKGELRGRITGENYGTLLTELNSFIRFIPKFPYFSVSALFQISKRHSTIKFLKPCHYSLFNFQSSIPPQSGPDRKLPAQLQDFVSYFGLQFRVILISDDGGDPRADFGHFVFFHSTGGNSRSANPDP
jgi:hypothetical protein